MSEWLEPKPDSIEAAQTLDNANTGLTEKQEQTAIEVAVDAYTMGIGWTVATNALAPESHNILTTEGRNQTRAYAAKTDVGSFLKEQGVEKGELERISGIILEAALPVAEQRIVCEEVAPDHSACPGSDVRMAQNESEPQR